MMNDAALLDKGIKCLAEYTEWRKVNLCSGMSVDEISDAADVYCEGR